jgi:hypothetical protein
VSVDSTHRDFPAGIVGGNVFQAMSVGVNLAPETEHVVVQGNTFTGGRVNIQDDGRGNFVTNNPGYNNAFQPVTLVKPIDQTVTSSSTLVPDTALSVALAAPATYTLECLLFSDAAATAGMGEKMGFRYTGTYSSSAVSGRATIGGVEKPITAQPATASPLLVESRISTTHPNDTIQFYGFLFTASPGIFGLEWSQNAATPSALTVRRGSRCTLTRTA